MADNKPVYTGSIGHGGMQFVKAPVADTTKKGTTISKTGDDLRNGSKK